MSYRFWTTQMMSHKNSIWFPYLNGWNSNFGFSEVSSITLHVTGQREVREGPIPSILFTLSIEHVLNKWMNNKRLILVQGRLSLVRVHFVSYPCVPLPSELRKTSDVWSGRLSSFSSWKPHWGHQCSAELLSLLLCSFRYSFSKRKRKSKQKTKKKIYTIT